MFGSAVAMKGVSPHDDGWGVFLSTSPARTSQVPRGTKPKKTPRHALRLCMGGLVGE